MTTDTTALDVLKRARALIEKPENWTQQANARDAAGASVEPGDASAVCFCSYGAIFKVGGGNAMRVRAVSDACRALGKVVRGRFVAPFNDESTHAEVLAMFNKAIASLEAS